jgi:DNA primase
MSSIKVTPRQRELLEQATTAYQATVADAADYLLGRGITGEVAKEARLGYVREPLPGHEPYKGRLAIPYLTKTGVMDMRFRCADSHDCQQMGHPKYLSQAGHSPRLYNATAWEQAEDIIAITEGEFDALVLTHRVGIPALGISGVAAWKTYYRAVFEDFAEVLVFGDGDDAGRDWARLVCMDLDNARAVHMPSGHDVTSFFMAEGPTTVLEVAGVV